MEMSERVALALAVWAVGASVLAGWLGWRARSAERKARIALRMAADAVEARVEMERNTPLMVLAGPDGRAAVTMPLRRVQYWLN